MNVEDIIALENKALELQTLLMTNDGPGTRLLQLQAVPGACAADCFGTLRTNLNALRYAIQNGLSQCESRRQRDRGDTDPDGHAGDVAID